MLPPAISRHRWLGCTTDYYGHGQQNKKNQYLPRRHIASSARESCKTRHHGDCFTITPQAILGPPGAPW
jgi:hypothetical protein